MLFETLKEFYPLEVEVGVSFEDEFELETEVPNVVDGYACF